MISKKRFMSKPSGHMHFYAFLIIFWIGQAAKVILKCILKLTWQQTFFKTLTET